MIPLQLSDDPSASGLTGLTGLTPSGLSDSFGLELDALEMKFVANITAMHDELIDYIQGKLKILTRKFFMKANLKK